MLVYELETNTLGFWQQQVIADLWGQLGLELDLEHWVKFGEKSLLTISWQFGLDSALVWLAIFCFLLLSGAESSLLVPFSVLCSQVPLISP